MQKNKAKLDSSYYTQKLIQNESQSWNPKALIRKYRLISSPNFKWKKYKLDFVEI